MRLLKNRVKCTKDIISSLEADDNVIFFPFIATAEPGDEESVTRAKYFIRDEFLVRIVQLLIKCLYCLRVYSFGMI